MRQSDTFRGANRAKVHDRQASHEQLAAEENNRRVTVPPLHLLKGRCTEAITITMVHHHASPPCFIHTLVHARGQQRGLVRSRAAAARQIATLSAPSLSLSLSNSQLTDVCSATATCDTMRATTAAASPFARLRDGRYWKWAGLLATSCGYRLWAGDTETLPEAASNIPGKTKL